MSEFRLMFAQVLINFVATGYLTFLLVLAYYILGFVDVQYLNSIDQSFLRHVWRFTKAGSTTRQASILRKTVLMYSDQQLVTGIALLVSGFSQLRYGLASYHWQILVYLVWFSSLTHLTTLTVLRQYFRNNSAFRSCRAVVMLVTVIMLGVALVPTGNPYWAPAVGNDDHAALAGVPVLCFYKPDAPYTFNQDATSGPLSGMIVSVLVLFFGYLTRFVKLSSGAAAFSKRWLRIAPGSTWKRWMATCSSANCSGTLNLFMKIIYIMMETVYGCLHGWYELYDSMLWEVSFW